jgi:hypothetical protein
VLALAFAVKSVRFRSCWIAELEASNPVELPVEPIDELSDSGALDLRSIDHSEILSIPRGRTGFQVSVSSERAEKVCDLGLSNHPFQEVFRDAAHAGYE